MTREAPIEDKHGRWDKCAWCGRPPVTEIELEPVRYTHRKGPDGKRLKLIKHRALMAPVCADHEKSLWREKQ